MDRFGKPGLPPAETDKPMAMILSINILDPHLLAGAVGILLGVAIAVIVARTRSGQQEARRYFLMNEAGNVLISTSTRSTEQLPAATLSQFSEALAHLSAVYFAISRSKDPKTGLHYSLYNYQVIKKALAMHPVFICTSQGPPRDPTERKNVPEVSEDLTPKEEKKWLEDRVHCSRKALRMGNTSVGQRRLRDIHVQMFAEAQRLRAAEKNTSEAPYQEKTTQSSTSDLVKTSSDEVEIGHITLYCECLMGISLVSLKLVHAHYKDYLHPDSPSEMETDTYLFISPSQLRNTQSELRHHS